CGDFTHSQPLTAIGAPKNRRPGRNTNSAEGFCCEFCKWVTGSSTARLRLIRGPSTLFLEVEDAGHGIREDAPSGVGIASMRERVQQLDGRLEIASHAGGTTVKATIPLTMVSP
ncbi:MAG: hypothetical protein ABSH49_33395, partial [Bryobacteraceae bacterium]